ncbi:MAG: alpha/beta fold hydrolase [Deltaproteobacteria bacterium]|nr:alpha/beta fold hydrolase [Deltaproteobacteria bacterium]
MDETIPPWRRALSAAGRASLAAGRGAARGVAAAYRSVDPDVRRHLAQLPLMSYSLFSRRGRPVTALEPDGHAPLVFVHGLGGGPGDFGPMAWYLRRRGGRRRTYSVAFKAGQGLDGRAASLAVFVREVLAATGEERVDLVAHSLGGLAARLAILEHDLGPSVRCLVTLGSPHGGTFYARLGNTALTRDLRPDGGRMRSLAAATLPDGLIAVSFWSRGDVVIIPPESAILPGSRAVETPNYTHYGYLIHPSSWKAVLEVLEGIPGPEDHTR